MKKNNLTQEIDKLVHDKRIMKGIGMILLSSLGFSTLGVIAKLAYAENVKVIQMLFFRSLICLPLFWGFALFITKNKTILSVDRKSAMAAMGAGVFSYYLTAIAGLTSLTYINANLGSLIFAFYPMFVILIDAFILKKLPPASHIAVLALSLLGIYFVMGGGSGKNIFMQNIVGVTWGFASAFFSALYVVLNQKITKKMDSMTFITYCMTGGFIVTTIHYLVTQGLQFTHINLKGFILICFSAIIFSFSMWIFSKGVRRIGASRSSLINNIGPVFTITFAYLVLGEKLTFLQLIGGAVVISSILLLERKIFVVLKLKKVFLIK